jgi:HSP20 family protein
MPRRHPCALPAARRARQAKDDRDQLTGSDPRPAAKEDKMAQSQALEVQEKKELVSKEEKTVPTRYYVPTTDIFETEDALVVLMEIPGVEKKDVEVNLENDALRVEARLDYSKYKGLEPLYTEYNVGHFARSFALSNQIDRQLISAELNDGILTLTLKKAKAAQPHRIAIA